jgi:hypothetical protein
MLSFGLVFFGTPHDGPTVDTKVRFGKICAAIAQALPGNPSNDIMQALEKGTLFSDHLHEHFRQQLEQYQIVSFYEGIGNVGLPPPWSILTDEESSYHETQPFLVSLGIEKIS